MTTCPNCGAPLLAELTGLAVCPQCGKTLRSIAAADLRDDSEPPQRTNRQVGLMVLAIMVLMASLALAFALRTTQFRRDNDTKGQEKAKGTAALPMPIPPSFLG